MIDRRRLLALLAVALATIGLCALVKDTLRPSESRPAPPRRSENSSQRVSVSNRDGSRRELRPADGKVLIVHFWATWCPPCVEELPGLIAYERSIRGQGRLELLTVSVDKDFATVDAWLTEHQLAGLPLALDPEKAAANAFGTRKFPETWVVGPGGRILDYFQGALDWSDKSLRDRLLSHAERLGSS